MMAKLREADGIAYVHELTLGKSDDCFCMAVHL